MVGNTSCHFCRLDARPDRVDEGMAEHRHEIIVLQHRPLDLLRQLLAFGPVIGSQVLLELVVERLDAEEVLGLEAAAA